MSEQEYTTAFCELCHKGEHVPIQLASGRVVCICYEVARNGLRKVASQ